MDRTRIAAPPETSRGRRRGLRRRLRTLSTLALCTLGLVVGVAVPAGAFPDRLSRGGHLDFDYGSAVNAAGGPGTSYKPESKLFYTGGHDGERVRWWAVVGTSDSSPGAGVWLWQLEHHRWHAEVRLPGSDPWAKADALYRGRTLTVSLRDDRDTRDGNPRESNLYSVRYRGDGAWDRASRPTRITTRGVETLTIARDGLDRIWATYEADGKIWVGAKTRSGSSFAFFELSRTDVKADDVSSVVSFGGDRVGVFWSDQNARRDVFAWHRDSDPVRSGWHLETAYGGGVGDCPTEASGLCADDHMNVKVRGGEIFVAIKTGLNDAPSPATRDPLIVLLHRDDGGRWTSSEVSTVGQDATRPIVLVDPAMARIWVWATMDRRVVVWQAGLGSRSFHSERWAPWVSGAAVNDATSTKQTTTDRSGVVVLVSAAAEDQFWHNEFLPG